MYAQLRQGLPAAPLGLGDLRARLLGRGVSRNVVGLGFTSLLTDISSEMVSTVLPMYVLLFLRLSPLQFGALDGVYQGGAAMLRLLGGLAADRSQRYKEVAGLGYALSAVSKLGLLGGALGGPPVLAGSLFVDRTGKALRTAPRDALISLSSPSSELGLAFAVHRALDTCGALLGPLMAFALLALVPDGYDVVFVTSLCFAVLGLGVLGLFVSNRAMPSRRSSPAGRPGELGTLWRDRQLRRLAAAAAVLGLTTISDAFVYLTLQHRLSFPASFIPLLFVATSLVYLVLAVPAGRLADRVGRGRVFLAGYGLMLGVYTVLLMPSLGSLELGLAILLLGGYYAATDGVLMAMASSLLPASVRTTGLAAVSAANGAGALAASLAFGGLWTCWGPGPAVAAFAAGLVAATFIASRAISWHWRA
jgi:MFS family permease